MARKIVLGLMTLFMVAAVTPSAEACWACGYFDGLYWCAETGGVGTDYCYSEVFCSGGSCSSWCSSSGNHCRGAGGGGQDCAVMGDGTVICEEHKGVRTTNGEIWPESLEATVCGA